MQRMICQVNHIIDSVNRAGAVTGKQVQLVKGSEWELCERGDGKPRHTHNGHLLRNVETRETVAVEVSALFDYFQFKGRKT